MKRLSSCCWCDGHLAMSDGWSSSFSTRTSQEVMESHLQITYSATLSKTSSPLIAEHLPIDMAVSCWACWCCLQTCWLPSADWSPIQRLRSRTSRPLNWHTGCDPEFINQAMESTWRHRPTWWPPPVFCASPQRPHFDTQSAFHPPSLSFQCARSSNASFRLTYRKCPITDWTSFQSRCTRTTSISPISA